MTTEKPHAIDSLHKISHDANEGLLIGACVIVNALLDSPAVLDHYRILPLARHELATRAL